MIWPKLRVLMWKKKTSLDDDFGMDERFNLLFLWWGGEGGVGFLLREKRCSQGLN